MTAQEMELKNKKELKTAGEGTRPGPVFVPPVDILENEQEIVILADMPGVDGKDVSIHLENGQLTIAGKISPVEAEKEVSLYREFHWGDYYRQFTLSDMIDQTRIKAKMDTGVLRLILPKAEKMKPRKIQVLTE